MSADEARIAVGASLQYGPTDEYGVAHGAPITTTSAPCRVVGRAADGRPRNVPESVGTEHRAKTCHRAQLGRSGERRVARSGEFRSQDRHRLQFAAWRSVRKQCHLAGNLSQVHPLTRRIP